MTEAQHASERSPKPIFVLGRQHSGNTMLVTLLGGIPSVLGLQREGTFFEVYRELDRLPPKQRARLTARKIRDDGVVRDREMWRAITSIMKKAARQGATATELYVVGMREVLRLFGEERWAQKATSYIFLVDEILEIFPEARLVFLIRNPLDLAASSKRRSTKESYGLLRIAMGWSRGVRYALRVEADKPDHLMVLRYEDLVSDAERSVRQVCTFCGLPFDPAYLDIPHVNKSEDPHRLESEQRGLNASRIYYYRSILTLGEIRALHVAIDGTVLDELYPELPRVETSLKDSAEAFALLGRSAARLLVEEGRRLVREPSRAFARMTRRLRRTT